MRQDWRAAAELRSVAHETRLERRLDRLIARAENPRKAAVVIATVTTSITVVAGVLMRFVDHDNFPTIGGGLWWAVQTVTTVGYGDHVPTNDAGQLLATRRDAARDRVPHRDHGFDHRGFRDAIEPGAGAHRRSGRRVGTDEDVRSIHERLDRIEAAIRELA